jgi:predicted permease
MIRGKAPLHDHDLGLQHDLGAFLNRRRALALVASASAIGALSALGRGRIFPAAQAEAIAKASDGRACLGTYLVLSTVGIVLICLYAEGAVTRSEIVKRIVTFPPLIALVVAVALLPVPYPPVLSSVLAPALAGRWPLWRWCRSVCSSTPESSPAGATCLR